MIAAARTYTGKTTPKGVSAGERDRQRLGRFLRSTAGRRRGAPLDHHRPATAHCARCRRWCAAHRNRRQSARWNDIGGEPGHVGAGARRSPPHPTCSRSLKLPSGMADPYRIGRSVKVRAPNGRTLDRRPTTFSRDPALLRVRDSRRCIVEPDRRAERLEGGAGGLFAPGGDRRAAPGRGRRGRPAHAPCSPSRAPASRRSADPNRPGIAGCMIRVQRLIHARRQGRWRSSDPASAVDAHRRSIREGIRRDEEDRLRHVLGLSHTAGG